MREPAFEAFEIARKCYAVNSALTRKLKLLPLGTPYRKFLHDGKMRGMKPQMNADEG